MSGGCRTKLRTSARNTPPPPPSPFFVDRNFRRVPHSSRVPFRGSSKSDYMKGRANCVKCEVADGASASMGCDNALSVGMGNDISECFCRTYRYRLAHGNQPSMTLMIKVHARQAAEFMPISRISSAVEGRVSALEPVRLRKSPPTLIGSIIVQFAKNRPISQIPGKLRALRADTSDGVCVCIRAGPPGGPHGARSKRRNPAFLLLGICRESTVCANARCVSAF